MKRLALAGATAGVVLGGVILAELTVDISAPAPDFAAPRPSASTSAQTNGAPATSVDDTVRQVEARPLFTRGRTPAHVDTPLLEATGTFSRRLTGVVIEPTRRAAIFGAEGGKRGVIVAEGGQIEGWLVAAVTPKNVTLRSATQYQVLELARGKTASVTTTPTSTVMSYAPRLVTDDPDAPASPPGSGRSLIAHP